MSRSNSCRFPEETPKGYPEGTLGEFPEGISGVFLEGNAGGCSEAILVWIMEDCGRNSVEFPEGISSAIPKRIPSGILEETLKGIPGKDEFNKILEEFSWELLKKKT